MNRLAKIVRFSFFTFICFVELLFYPPSLKADDILFPNFEESLLRYGKSKTCHSSYYNFATKDPNILQIRENTKKFKAIYKKNIRHFTSNKSVPCRIPKIVHQIWIGSPVPDNFKILMNTWVIPGWEYKLWTDREVEQFGLYNQQLYDNAKDYGEKSDILRYEILFREGGVYADVDFECWNPQLLENFNKSFDLYMGFEPIEHKSCPISHLVGNALIGSVPKHPILKNLIRGMGKHYKNNYLEWAVVTTGPVYLTQTILKYIEVRDKKFINIFLPPTFLFPLTATDIKKDLIGNKQNLKPETAAIHYWSGSWK